MWLRPLGQGEEGQHLRPGWMLWSPPFSYFPAPLPIDSSPGGMYIPTRLCSPSKKPSSSWETQDPVLLFLRGLWAKKTGGSEVCRLWLLAIQMPINRPGWWKVCFNSGQISVQRQTPWYPQQAGAFIDIQKQHSHLLTVIFKLVISDLTNVILAVLGTVNLHVPGSICSQFFGANSQNCGSSCPGYSLVIM